MRPFTFRPTRIGNPGNIMMIYLTAHRMQKLLGFGDIANVSIPIFGIELPDKDTSGTIGLHDRENGNGKARGLFPFAGYKRIIENSDAKFLSFEAYNQNINNFYCPKIFDYDAFFPPMRNQTDCGKVDELIISIRGGEVLQAVHPDYTQIPIDFYQYLITRTGLKPVFFGQLNESPYLQALRSTFRTARFLSGRSPQFDFDFLRKSKNIVPSISTFAWMASWLSDAERIFLPLNGVLNPHQVRSTMLIPHNDPRYELYLFPLNYCLPIDRYQEYHDPIRGLWRKIPDDSLFSRPPLQNRSLDNYLLCFDPLEYIDMYPDKRSSYDEYGYAGLINDFIENAFWAGYNSCRVDPVFYTRTYPIAAMDIAMGVYLDPMHHYSEVGRLMGFKKSLEG